MTKRSWILTVFVLGALFGILNAGYLTILSLSGQVPTCNFAGGCEIVATSAYSKVLGIPLSLFGVFFYFVAGALALWAFKEKTIQVAKWLVAVTGLGFLFSLYFMYLQAFVIQAFCDYCIFSFVDSVLLFLLSLLLFYTVRKKPETNETEM